MGGRSVVERILFLEVFLVEQDVVLFLFFLYDFRLFIVEEESIEIIVLFLFELVIIIVFPELIRVEVVVDFEFILVLEIIIEVFLFPFILVMILHGQPPSQERMSTQ